MPAAPRQCQCCPCADHTESSGEVTVIGIVKGCLGEQVRAQGDRTRKSTQESDCLSWALKDE